MRELKFREATNLCATHSRLPWEPKPGLAYSRGLEPPNLLVEEPARPTQAWELDVLSMSGIDKMFEESKVILLGTQVRLFSIIDARVDGKLSEGK